MANLLLKNAYSSQPCGFELCGTHVELIKYATKFGFLGYDCSMYDYREMEGSKLTE